MTARFNAYLGDRISLTTTKYGDKIFVDTRDVSITPHILFEGNWEEWVSDAFERVVASGSTVVDVGANCGWYTLLACRKGAKAVHAFEPNPRMAALLARSVAINGWRDKVTIHQCAAGAEAGTARLIFSTENTGGAFLSKLSEEMSTRYTAAWTPVGGRLPVITDGYATDDKDLAIGVAVKRLDDVLPTGEVNVIKIDTEGSEPDVIRGAMDIIRRSPAIQVFLEHRRETSVVLERLVAEGLSLYHVQHDGRLVAKDLAAASALDDIEMIVARR